MTSNHILLMSYPIKQKQAKYLKGHFFNYWISCFVKFPYVLCFLKSRLILINLQYMLKRGK